MGRITIIIIVAVVFCFIGCVAGRSAAKIEVPAFPGADGFGKYAFGGRGGKVYEVTNLSDSGPGSLREAIDANGPRIVVFQISGTIELKSALRIANPYITIAGQTAPGDGICLKNYPLTVAADEVIVRYLRMRPGDSAGEAIDALSVCEGKNIIIDHCSASWGVDETLSVANDAGGAGLPCPNNVTVQWCIISESLNKSVHPKGKHGYGTLAKGGWGSGYTFHHNLYAHHSARNPYPGNYNDKSIDPNGLIFDFRNNVIYNWGGICAGYNTQRGADSVTWMNFVGNYYKQGPNSEGSYAFLQQVTASRGYFSDNWMNGTCPADPWSLVLFDKNWNEAQKDAYKQTKPIQTTAVQMDNVSTAYKRVLAEAGASLPVRDAVDRRIVEQVQKGSGGIINNPKDVGGWPILNSAAGPVDSDHDGMPDSWEIEKGLNPNDAGDGAKDRDGDGYTNIEEYINGLCRQVFR